MRYFRIIPIPYVDTRFAPKKALEELHSDECSTTDCTNRPRFAAMDTTNDIFSVRCLSCAKDMGEEAKWSVDYV